MDVHCVIPTAIEGCNGFKLFITSMRDLMHFFSIASLLVRDVVDLPCVIPSASRDVLDFSCVLLPCQ